jgi:hypothetical protein
MAYSKAELKGNGDKALVFFQTILSRKHVRQMFASPDSTIGFIETHFY